MNSIEITLSGPIYGEAQVPGSKSITNRALILAALADGETVLASETVLENALESEDTAVMFEALRALGLTLSHDPSSRRMTIMGCGGRFPVPEADFVELYVGNSGTTARFLTAALAFSGSADSSYRIHGKPRMHERPIGDLLKALAQLGANIHCEQGNDCPPLRIGQYSQRAAICNRENTQIAQISGNISSQFLSALLMAAPLASEDRPVQIELIGELVSVPYIHITTEMMRSFGVSVEIHNQQAYIIPQGSKYRPLRYIIEPDASAASYFFAAAAVAGGRVTIAGIGKDALQGDIHFVECLQKMGCLVTYSQNGPEISTTVERPNNVPLRGIEVDMNAISDTAQTLAVVALFADGPTRITNIGHVRHKETDRIAATATELRKLGATVTETDDSLVIVPPKSSDLRGAAIDTYDDHRMAMSFAIAGLRIPNVVIRDPKCTEKTFPGFFDELQRLTNR